MGITAKRKVGKTPLLELKRISSELCLRARIFAKLEMFNPTGSSKDRAALRMLGLAEREGRLKSGGFVCATSGNMGISLAALAAARGHRAVIVIPKSMSSERRKILRAYGAELLLVDGGMPQAEELASSVAAKKGCALLDQFEDMSNPEAHYMATGPEIWKDTGRRVDLFVAGVGSGGTLSGVGRYLKEKDPAVRTVAVEPAASPVLSGGSAGPHGIQGIGAGFIPKTLDLSVVDEILSVTEEEAVSFARLLAKREGILAGISSGAALSASIRLARRAENEGKRIVTVFADGGERYLSTELFA